MSPTISEPGWDDWKDRDEPDFADHVEGIAQAYACLEEAREVPSIAAVHAVILLADNHLVEGKKKPRFTTRRAHGPPPSRSR